MAPQLLLIMTTCNAKKVLETMAHDLVHEKVVACAQLSGPFTSSYLWNNQFETENEWQLILKTSFDLKSHINHYIKTHHPYDCPEIIYLSVDADSDYLAWVKKNIT